MSKPTGTARASALIWKAPLAGALALLSSVLVATVALGLAGITPTPAADANPRLVLAGALVPVALIILATLGGLLWAISSIGLLTGEAVSGRKPRLGFALGRGLRVLPKLVVIALVGALAVLVSVVAFPVLSLGALGRAGWRLRAGTGRRRELLLAVPLAGTLVLLAAVPVALASTLRSTPLRTGLRAGLTLTWATRGRVLLGAALLGLVSWGLGIAGVHLSGISAAAADDRARTTEEFAAGTAGLGLMTLLLTLVAGALLGLLSSRVAAGRPEDPSGAPAGPGLRVPGQRQPRLLSWRPARLAAVALVVSATLTLDLAGAAAVAPLAAAAVPPAAAVVGADLVVTSLDDSVTPEAGECVDPALACTLRGALAEAAARSLDGPVDVSLDVAGTIALVDTLEIAKGVTLDASDRSVTLDAGGAVRAIHAFDPAGESAGGQATLRGLTVTGGRTDGPGAGLFSDNVNVVLEQMTFRDNTSGPDPADGSRVDGGAVAVPFATLTVRDSTFTRNRALTGTGAAVNAGTLDWLNSTSYEDRGVVGEPNGGAITAGTGTVSHATLIGGGGVAGGSWGPLVVTNSIVDVGAGAGDFTCMDIARATDDPASGGNLDPSGMCVGLTGRPAPHGPLADNGGPTQTVALLPGSPALGAGLAASCAPTDQRGTPRAAGRCDAGAFQMTSDDLPVVDIALTSDNNPSGHGGATTLRATLTSPQPVPAGTVQLFEGTTPVGASVAPDAAGVAVLTTTALAQGAHELRATYTPTDTTLPTATSGPVRQVVQAAVTLTITAPAPTRVHDPAVVTVTVVPGAGSDPTLVPSGVVDVSSGTESATLPLVDGAATWTLPALTSATVTATYVGDDAFGWTVLTADVTSADIATTTTVTLDSGTAPFGTPATATVQVSDARGPVEGTVELVVDGAVRGNALRLDDGLRAFELSLSPGRHTVLARTTPDTGWEASVSAPVTLTVTAATSSVVLTAPATSSYGETVTADVTLTGVGTAVVELLDGDTVVDTSPVLSLPVSWPLHVRDDLDVGVHTFTARILASATTAGAVSAPVAHTVTPQPISFWSADGANVVLGERTTISVLPNPYDVPGQVTATDPATGAVLASGQRLGDDGATLLTYVAAAAGAHSVLVSFQPDSSNYSPAVTTVTFDVARAPAPTPTATWSAAPTPGSTTLTVQYPPSSPPVGPASLLVFDAERNVYVASGALVDGRAELSFYGPAGQCYCSGSLRLELGGDSNYLPTLTSVPDLDLPAHATTTTLEPLPSSVPRFARLDLVANVASPTVWPLTGTVVFAVNGAPQPPVALPSSGRAYLQYVPAGPGTYRISAAFVPDTTTASPSASATRDVLVEAAPLPLVELTTTSAATVEQSMYLQVTTRTSADLIVPGSQLALVDEAGTVLGWSTWASGSSSAFFLHSPALSGPQTLRVRFVYGPDTTIGFSEPLSLDAAGLWSQLSLVPDESVFVATVDGPLWLRAGLITTPERRTTLGTMQVSLYANGVLLETRPLHPWDETVWFPTSQDRIGPVQYTVTTTGDGLKFGAGRGALVHTVRGAPADLRIQQATSQHRGPWTIPFRLTPLPSRPAPSGTVLITLTDTDGGTSYVGCQVTLPATSCTQDGAFLPAGTYTTSAVYSGDGIYASSSDTDELRVTSQRGEVRTTFSPPRSEWVEGTPVTATWTTKVPAGSSADGVVTVEHNAGTDTFSTLCRVPATSGTCTFAVPSDGRPLRDLTDEQRRNQDYRTVYTPSAFGLDPSYDFLFGPAAPRCLRVTSATSWTYFQGDTDPPAPTLEGQTCSVSGRSGYREGTQVSADLTVTAPHRVGSWRIQDGVGPRDDAAPAFTYLPWSAFVLEEQTRVVAHLVWAPTCVTVRVTSEPTGQPYDPAVTYDPGVVTLRTQPNCADPVTPSEYELEQLQKGIGRYAVGTEVELSASARNPRVPTVDKPAYVLLDVPDVRPPDDDHYYYGITANEDREVYARFRLSKRMCTPTRFFTGGGGSLALLGSELPPATTYPFEDPQGICVDPTGSPGFWPGTTVRVAAKGHNDGTGTPGPSNFRFDTWLEGPGPDGVLHQDKGTPAKNNPDWSYTPAVPSAQEIALRPVTSVEAAPRSYYDTVPGRVVVPLSPDFRFGVRFANLSCQSVETALTYPTGQYTDEPPVGVVRTPGNCPAMAYDNDQWTTGPTGGGWYDSAEKAKTVHTRTWYTPGTKVTATAPTQTFQTLVPADRWSAYRQTREESSERTVDWVVREENGKAGPVTTTPEVVVATDKRMFLEGRYVTRGAECISPKITVRPERFGYDVVGGGGCPTGQMSPDGGTLRAAFSQEMSQGLVPHWVFHGPAWKIPEQLGRTQLDYYNTAVASSQITFDDARYYGVSLTYCAPIDVGINIVDATGKHVGYYNDAEGRQVTAPPAKDIIGAAGGCPVPLSVEPGTQAQIGLNTVGINQWRVRGWQVNGQSVSGTPTVRVDPNGKVLDRVSVTLTPNCHTLSTGDKVFVRTQGDCPGGGNRSYLHGTPVEVAWNGSGADEFKGWRDVDASDAGVAIVVMYRDRHVTVDYHTPEGFELAVKITTSLVQRAIAALVTAATGTVMGLLFLVQAASLVVVGISAGLRAIGVEGAVLDRIDGAVATVQSALDTIQSVQDCTVSWATGGAGPPLSVPSYQGGQGAAVASSVAGDALEAKGYTRSADGLGAASSAFDTVNIFAGGLGGYFAEPRDSWMAFAGIGSCVRDSAIETANRATRAVT